MTCIVGIEEDGVVYMGGDSASIAGWDGYETRLRKVFKRGEFLIGYSTSFRMGQLLQYRLHVDPQDESQEDLEYMATTFIDGVRECLKHGAFTKVEDEVEKGGSVLVGYRGVLYRVDSDMQVNSSRDGFMAAGSGEPYALGYLLGTRGLYPENRIIAALETAGHFCVGVSPPFYVENSKEGCG